MLSARFVDVGLLEPALFHATYAAIAYAAEDDAPPVVMWGRARAHLSLGQSQDRAAELAPVVDVPIVTRPLGGGVVWIDESLTELAELLRPGGRRAVPHGIRLNAAACPTERREGGRVVREITVDGAVVKHAVTAA
ncbi:MAG: hypothetical protein A3G24_10810 [Betaproteobacteria bacterium RIFCSPLOWO2_12_FULL_62_13]|nr:MAG: hypothetical protein A3G24_10810 [Betaproteobacteria bacterium RIFCSPLOWO2_12_FULL_62_13]